MTDALFDELAVGGHVAHEGGDLRRDRRYLLAGNDPRTVVADPQARYFGAELSEHALTPGTDATLLDTRLADWAAAD